MKKISKILLAFIISIGYGLFFNKTFTMDEPMQQAGPLTQTSSSSSSVQRHFINQLNALVRPERWDNGLPVPDQLQQQVDKILEGAVLTPVLLRYWIQFGTPMGLHNALERMTPEERIRLVNARCATPNAFVTRILFGNIAFDRDTINGTFFRTGTPIHTVLDCDFFGLAFALGRHRMIEVLLYAGYREGLNSQLSMLLSARHFEKFTQEYLTAILDSAVRYGALINCYELLYLAEEFGRQAGYALNRYHMATGDVSRDALQEFIGRTLISELKFLIRLVVLYIRQINIPTHLPTINRDVLQNVVGHKCALLTPLAGIVVSYDSPIPCVLPPHELPTTMSQQEIIEKVIMHILFRAGYDWEKIYKFIMRVRPIINATTTNSFRSSSSSGSASVQSAAAAASAAGAISSADVDARDAQVYCTRIMNAPTIIDSALKRLLDGFNNNVPHHYYNRYLPPSSSSSSSSSSPAANAVIFQQSLAAMTDDNIVVVDPSVHDQARERAQAQARPHGLHYISLQPNPATQNPHGVSTIAAASAAAVDQIANRQRDNREMYSGGAAAASADTPGRAEQITLPDDRPMTLSRLVTHVRTGAVALATGIWHHMNGKNSR